MISGKLLSDIVLKMNILLKSVIKHQTKMLEDAVGMMVVGVP